MSAGALGGRHGPAERTRSKVKLESSSCAVLKLGAAIAKGSGGWFGFDVDMATIVSRSHTLSLADPSLPPLMLQLTQLRDSLLLFVGTVPGPYAIGHDFACGMTVRPPSHLPS